MSAFEDAFFQIASRDEEPFLYVNQLDALLTTALGTRPTAQELELYEKAFEKSESGRFTYPELEKVVQRIQGTYALLFDYTFDDVSNATDFLKGEAHTKIGASAQPVWLTSSAATKPKVLQGHSSLSSHHIDFGKYGQTPGQRPYIRKTGMASTTSDLMVGTSRDTHHIPGYCGFIPRAGNNPEAVEQGDGRTTRARHADLRLYHSDDIPGYTGHKPVSCGNYRGEMSVCQCVLKYFGKFRTKICLRRQAWTRRPPTVLHTLPC